MKRTRMTEWNLPECRVTGTSHGNTRIFKSLGQHCVGGVILGFTLIDFLVILKKPIS
jgi:hypothetical protein